MRSLTAGAREPARSRQFLADGPPGAGRWLPAYPTLLAAVQMDDTGTTRIGRFVFNHPFLVPGTINIAVTVGFVLGSLIL